tara:strand:+ start:197 stop:1105 length:909 start_codon:yes stop_codon:yes gene_type:complete
MEDAQPMKKQETSKEKSLSTTQADSSSDPNQYDYRVADVLEELKSIDDWDVEEMSVKLMDWSEQQHFGQTEFQNKYYVVNSQVTPYRQIRQAMMEIQGRTNSLSKSTIQLKRCMNDIARVKHDMDDPLRDEFEKQDKQYELELLFLDRQIWINKIKQCKDELDGLFNIIKEKAGTDDPVEITNILENKELEEVEEHKYWIARMGKQSAIDLLTTGRVQAGNLESILQMNPEDQAACLDLAMTYSTAVNRSVGGIKEAAEARVDKMMEGKPPQLFDTAGVLSDYAQNNLQERLQSSDKPKTDS